MDYSVCEDSKLRTIIVMPAYNAATTLEKTIKDISKDSYVKLLLVDDCSTDDTVEIAKRLGIDVIEHEANMGYGANQKTCYDYALQNGADIIVMLHPDYQYDARLIPFFTGFLKKGTCDVMLGCRIRTRSETLKCGMPFYKYISNRFLTITENIALGQNLGDFHSGFRCYTRKVLETIPYENNSNDFVFDSQFLAQVTYYGFKMGDAPIPCRYFDEASSINFKRSLKYGFLTLNTLLKYVLQKNKIFKFNIFNNSKKANGK